jgi:hypothetical protein
MIDDELLAPYRSKLPEGDSGDPDRLVFAAAHVVMEEGYRACGHSAQSPGDAEEIASHVDWSATMSIRRHLDACGFGVAEAMDTAQRYSLGWASARRLIEECGKLQLAHGFVAGAGVDHLRDPGSKSEIIDGVVYQARSIQEAGGIVTILPMVWLAARKAGESEYVEIYKEIFAQLEGPLFVHWLGEMFLPELKGYFPGDSFRKIMKIDPEKVRGCKLSLLDAALELSIRRELHQREQIVLTGDDFHFAGLIRGGEVGKSLPQIEKHLQIGSHRVAFGDFSHALLGVLDGVAVPAGLALELLSRGDASSYDAIMAPVEELGRWIFQAPTSQYKAGLAFLAWLNGLQKNFMLVNREESLRSRDYLLGCAELAATAGALSDTKLAASRLAELAAD